jgi:hypothetical protein
LVMNRGELNELAKILVDPNGKMTKRLGAR